MRILCYFTCSFMILTFVHSVKQQFDKMGIYLPSYKKKEKDKKQYRELLEIIKHVNNEPKVDSEKYVPMTDFMDNDLDDFINTL